jgi:hypothetical protein
MPKRSRQEDIFEKTRLEPNQLRTVADRRLEDAEYLENSARNKHANGAMYLGGFVVECLLKAELLDQYPWLSSSARLNQNWPKEKQRLWALCYRSHALDELFGSLPGHRLQLIRKIGGPRIMEHVKAVCIWTIYARYSPKTATIRHAEDFLKRVREIRSCLKAG